MEARRAPSPSFKWAADKDETLLGSIPLVNQLFPSPNAPDPSLARALEAHRQAQLHAAAQGDVRTALLAGLGVGAVGAGGIGLARLARRNLSRPKTTSGPALLPLPYPVAPERRGAEKRADGPASKGGLWWYTPALAAAAAGGGLAGYTGVSSLLHRRTKADREDELEAARQDFHGALLSQYKRPLVGLGKTAVDGEDCPSCGASMERGDDGSCNSCGKAWPDKAAAALGPALDRLYDDFNKLASLLEKRGLDKEDIPGALGGGYALYAGITGLAGGSVAYDQMKKRSRRAVLEKAIKRRDRRRFMQQPTEIYATPEPMPVGPRPAAAALAGLHTAPEDEAVTGPGV